MSVVKGSGLYGWEDGGGRGMSRWYVASRDIVGEMRREERKGERCVEVRGLEERALRASIMRSVSVIPVSSTRTS